MACGCTSTCGCNIVAGAGMTVQRVGDTFTVSLGSFPIDPDSTAPVSWTSGAGLRVDCCPPEITVGDTPPAAPDEGDIWFDTSP